MNLPAIVSFIARSTEAQLVILCVVAGALLALAVWVAVRRRETPESMEHKRLAALQAHGRLGDALVTDVHENQLFYTYTLRGIQYATSQNVALFRDRLPENLETLVGSQGMKYSTTNPVDSMLICAEWSGLRVPARVVEFGTASTSSLANRDVVGHASQNASPGERAGEQLAKRQAAS